MNVLVNDFEIMGTVFRFAFALQAKEAANNLLPAVHAMLSSIEDTYSTYKVDSEVVQLQRGVKSMQETTLEVQWVYQQCLNWKAETSGHFDAINPAGLWDPSGFVKGWAAQSAANFLESNGVKNFSLNAGGDVYVGEQGQREFQRVGLLGLRNFSEAGFEPDYVLDLSESPFRAVATSGSVERGAHIWKADDSILQVSVLAENLIAADVWATAVCVGGEKLVTRLEQAGLQIVIFRKDRSMYSSPGLDIEKY